MSVEKKRFSKQEKKPTYNEILSQYNANLESLKKIISENLQIKYDLDLSKPTNLINFFNLFDTTFRQSVSNLPDNTKNKQIKIEVSKLLKELKLVVTRLLPINLPLINKLINRNKIHELNKILTKLIGFYNLYLKNNNYQTSTASTNSITAEYGVVSDSEPLKQSNTQRNLSSKESEPKAETGNENITNEFYQVLNQYLVTLRIKGFDEYRHYSINDYIKIIKVNLTGDKSTYRAELILALYDLYYSILNKKRILDVKFLQDLTLKLNLENTFQFDTFNVPQSQTTSAGNFSKPSETFFNRIAQVTNKFTQTISNFKILNFNLQPKAPASPNKANPSKIDKIKFIKENSVPLTLISILLPITISSRIPNFQLEQVYQNTINKAGEIEKNIKINLGISKYQDYNIEGNIYESVKSYLEKFKPEPIISLYEEKTKSFFEEYNNYLYPSGYFAPNRSTRYLQIGDSTNGFSFSRFNGQDTTIRDNVSSFIKYYNQLVEIKAVYGDRIDTKYWAKTREQLIELGVIKVLTMDEAKLQLKYNPVVDNYQEFEKSLDQQNYNYTPSKLYFLDLNAMDLNYHLVSPISK
jgi:hypothetical protein